MTNSLHNQIFAGVKAPVIDLKNVEAIWIRLGELIQKPLIALGINMRKLAEEGFTCRRFNCCIEPKCFEQPLPLPNGFNTTRCDQSSDDGFKPKATLIRVQSSAAGAHPAALGAYTGSTARRPRRLQVFFKALSLLTVLLVILRTSDMSALL